MPIAATLHPAEALATILRWLGSAVASRGILQSLAAPVVALILDRIRTINQRFAQLATRLRDGTYRQRRAGPRRRPATRHIRARNPLPQNFGWLLHLVPEAVGHRSQLDHLLRHPETAALLAASPGAMARLLRPLCWALGLKPPSVLARPRPPAHPLAKTPLPADAPIPIRPHQAAAPAGPPAPTPSSPRKNPA